MSIPDHDLVSLPCPVCGSRKSEEIWRHQSGIVNGLCSCCGHVYLTSRHSDRVILESYKDYAQSYTEDFLKDESNSLFAIARERLAFLERNIVSSELQSVLEIGCSYGHFLKVAENIPEKYGIEPSSTQAFFARTCFGLEQIAEGPYETRLSSASRQFCQGFDAICAFHVVEHLANPAEFIRLVREQLRPDGYLVLALPNLQTLSPDLIELYFMCRSWHLHTFSTAIIGELLRRSGFKILSVVEEQPTAMLRSSFLMLARRSKKVKPEEDHLAVVVENRAAALRFHQSLNARLDRLRGVFSRWREHDKRIAIYGGGLHTIALLDLTGIDPGAVTLIIDDDPAKVGTRLSGVKIESLSESVMKQVDTILVSSLAAEQEILQRLEAEGGPAEIEVKGIYRDF